MRFGRDHVVRPVQSANAYCPAVVIFSDNVVRAVQYLNALARTDVRPVPGVNVVRAEHPEKQLSPI